MRRTPIGDVGPLVEVLDGQIVQHSSPRLRRHHAAILPGILRLFTGDCFLDLLRHGQEPTRLGKARVGGASR